MNDVLDMGKIEDGKFHLEKKPFKIEELVSSLVWSFKDIFDLKGIKLYKWIDDATKKLVSHH